jgi:glycosyltransferase involved in cell wall biosynthesis
MKKTIFVNGRFLTKAVTGVQRYAVELLTQMDLLLEAPEYRDLKLVCLAPPETQVFPAWKRIVVRKVGRNHGNLWEQVDLPFFARGEPLFSPANTGPLAYANQALTFHDAATFAVPEAYSRAFRAKYWLIFNSLARRARLLFTDSHFSQGQLASYLHVPAERFQVILLGGDHFNKIQPDTAVLDRQGLVKGTYFLTVASQSRHKNFECVIWAAQVLSTVQFVAVGGSFDRVFQAREQVEIPSNLRSLGYLSDRELKALYENALGYIFPSFYEGFGLPVLEAMQSDCPVICSSAASLPEVGGNAVLYFDPLSAESLISALERFLADPTLRLDLQARGRDQAAGFTWEKTARQTLLALRSCFE